MTNRYDRKYLVIHEPLVDQHRRRLFELKLNRAAKEGYEAVGSPHFFLKDIQDNKKKFHEILFCTVLTQRK